MVILTWLYKSLNSFAGQFDISDSLWVQTMESHGEATQMEQRFKEHVKKKFPPEQKRSTSGVIYAAFGEKIKNCLKNPEPFSKQFRHYVKKKNFRVFEIPSVGLKDVLVIRRSESDEEVWYTLSL